MEEFIYVIILYAGVVLYAMQSCQGKAKLLSIWCRIKRKTFWYYKMDKLMVENLGNGCEKLTNFVLGYIF